MKQIPALSGLLIVFYALFWSDISIANQGESITELINRLSNEYISINEQLKELDGKIRDFPDTSLTLSVTKGNKDISLLSIEVHEGLKLLHSHLYSPLENRVLEAEGRHQLYQNEIKEGYHIVKITYYWEERDKRPQKGETNINLLVSPGKKYLLQLSFRKRGTKLDLAYTLYVFKDI